MKWPMHSSPRAWRLFVAAIGLVAGAIAIGVVLLESGALDLAPGELEARYRLPNSQFALLAGVRVHYVDEGSGPPVVLVHASYMSLRTWDELAAALAQTHRVVRFDRVGMGLTGEDPERLYSRDRDMQVIDALLARLGIARAALVGTSSGGGVAFHYAASRPDRVTRLVRVNSGGLPRTAATDPNRPRGTWLERWILERHQSRDWWRRMLGQQFADGQPPDALVQQAYDMNRRAGHRAITAATLRNFRTGQPEQVLGRITAPTLVVWGLKNITLSHLEADVFQHWLVAASTAKIKYEDAGHYVYLEKPAIVARDVGAFLDDRLPLRAPVAPCLGPDAAGAAPRATAMAQDVRRSE